MIEYIKGRIEELTPATAVLETQGGVAYMLNISLNTFSELEKASSQDTQARLFVHESIREDAWVLYGFSTKEERSLFRMLVGVSGVGAATACIILSSHNVVELEHIIAGGEVKMLKQIKGIGAKTAERIIVDLRDKIKPGESSLLDLGIGQMSANKEVYDEALVALVTLGFARQASQKVLDKLFAAEPTLKVELAIKKALSML
ncbi:MAG: Holliday junction branch migration protein RuvA [Muribaculaceae bacterium]|nr:Holliday junction branch migration protein RuvA [Muribaculaceae bacterium]